MGLGWGLVDPLDEIGPNRQSEATSEEAGEEFSLVELTFPLAGRVEWDGHEQIPVAGRQDRTRCTEEEPPQERTEPDGTVVLEPVDDLPDHAFGQNSGPDRLE